MKLEVRLAQAFVSLHPEEATKVLEKLPTRFTIKAFESFPPVLIAKVIRLMPQSAGANCLEKLAPEVAGLVLAHLQSDLSVGLCRRLLSETRQRILRKMPAESGRRLRSLLHYPIDTAGGLMTTELVTFGQHKTVGAAIESLRETAETPNMIYYLYIVEGENQKKLAGIVTLRNLILSDSDLPLSKIMRTKFQSAEPNEPSEEVALKIAEYNLLALPVLDEGGEILGIVTVDDAMEILLPKRFD